MRKKILSEEVENRLKIEIKPIEFKFWAVVWLLEVEPTLNLKIISKITGKTSNSMKKLKLTREGKFLTNENNNYKATINLMNTSKTRRNRMILLR